MTKQRLDIVMVKKGLVPSRSQAESWIKLGKVTVNGRVVDKSGTFIDSDSNIKLLANEQYVSRAGLKLASVAQILKLNLKDKIVLDVGSSTGGFTDYALQHNAKKIYAVDVGTGQLHTKLRSDVRVELHEKTDIRNVCVVRSLAVPTESNAPNKQDELRQKTGEYVEISETPDIVLVDVSFISLRQILPHIHDNLVDTNTQIVAMVKPQFEAGAGQTNKGIIKNDAMRRRILRDFEDWSRAFFAIQAKRDSGVAGAKGNRERFYLLTPKIK